MNGFSVSGWFIRQGPRALIPTLIAILGTSVFTVAATSSQTGDSTPAQAKSQSPPEAAGVKKPAKPANKKAQANRAAKQAARKKNKTETPPADVVTTPPPKRPARTITPPSMTSAELDRLITQYLTKNSPKVEPAPLTTDVEFVRRIFFDVVGHPPTPAQVQAFLTDRTKDKRARLIEALLVAPDHARNWAKYWRDVVMFHSTNENKARVRFEALEDWLTKRLQANTPWDEIASGMITASGRNDENGAVAFPLAYEAQPVEMAGEVSRIFMGVQIQCTSVTITRPTPGSSGSFTNSRRFSRECGRARLKSRPPASFP